MNHSEHAGNKVHFFLSRHTIIQPLAGRYGLGPLISICMEATSLFPWRREGRARGKCFDLNGNIYHTCFFSPSERTSV